METPTFTAPAADAEAAAQGPAGDGYRYAAFISYRHVEPDRKWARWLHSALETYRVPRRLRRERDLPARLGRVFRDEEELSASADLSWEIEQALEQSRFLIVVCSPNTPGSDWVNREVQRFRELGRSDHILALLIQGEPVDAFPRSLREIRRTVTDARGLSSEQVEEVEPLAADVRPVSGEMGRARHQARLRLAAAVLGVRFDDLRQREHERKARRLVAAGAVLAALLCVMTGLAVFAFAQRQAARHQAGVAERRRVEADQQRAEADRQRQEADRQKRQAEDQKREAQTRLAEGLVAQGDALGVAGRWPEAFDRYEDGRDRFGKLGLSTLAADYAAWDAYRRTSPPLLAIAPPDERLSRGLFLPDGRRLLAASGRRLQRRSASSGVVERQFAGEHGGAILSLVGTADGRTAVTGSSDRTIRLWDVDGGREVRQVRDDAAVRAVAISGDGRVVLSGNEKQVMKVWDAATGRLAFAAPPYDEPLNCVALSPDGRLGLVGLTQGGVELWDVAARAKVRTMPGNTGGVMSCCFSADGSLAAAGDWNTRVHVWMVATGRPLADLTGHRGAVVAVAFAPGGRVLASGSRDGTARLWDLSAPEAVRTLAGHTGVVDSVAWSRDGRFLLTGGADGTLRTWAADPVPALRTLYAHDRQITALAVSPDGRLALSAATDGRMRLWDLAAARPLARAAVGYTSKLAFLPDGRSAVSLGSRSGVGAAACMVWDLTSDTGLDCVRSADVPGGGSAVMAVSSDGRLAWVARGTGELLVVDLAEGRVARTLPPIPRDVLWLALAPDDRTLLVSAGRTAEIRDAATGSVLRRLGPPDSVEWRTSATFFPDGRQIFGGGTGGSLYVWDVRTGEQVRKFRTEVGQTDAVAVAPDGRVALTGHRGGLVRMWDAERGTLLRSLPVHAEAVSALVWSSAGGLALSGSADGTVRCLDFAHLDRFRDLRPRAEAAAARLAGGGGGAGAGGGGAADLVTLGEWYALLGAWDRAAACLEQARATDSGAGGGVPPALLGRCYWQNGQPDLAAAEFAAAAAAAARAGGSDAVYPALAGRAARLEAQAGRGAVPLLHTYPGPQAPTLRVAVSPDGATAVTGGLDGVVRWWDLATGQPVRTFADRHDIVQGVAFLPDGQSVVSGASDGTVDLWRPGSLAATATWTAHDNTRAVAASPDGRTVASCGNDRTVKLWDVSPGPTAVADREPRTLVGHAGEVAAVAFSPDGRHVVSGSSDSSLIVWDVAAGRAVRTLRGHGDYVRAVAFAPDGRHVLSASKDKTLVVWDVSNLGGGGGGGGDPPRVTLTGHTAGVTAAAWTPDGRTVVSAGEDGTVRLWDAATGRELRRSGEGPTPHGLAVAPDGRTCLSVGEDRVLKVWDLTREQPAPATATVPAPVPAGAAGEPSAAGPSGKGGGKADCRVSVSGIAAGTRRRE